MFFYRELSIAKMKNTILAIPESVLGKTKEGVERSMHRMNAAGILIYDDQEDGAVYKIQNGMKVINEQSSQYIGSITEIINTLKDEAWEAVDMTAQRYGEIANSAGKGTTQEAIIRGTMGSVIVVSMFDKLRCEDLAGLVDYSKLAWVEGKNEAFINSDGKTRYMALDANTHINSDYMLHSRSSEELTEKLQILRDIAFSAAQNGDTLQGVAALKSNSIDAISKHLERLKEIQNQQDQEIERIQNERQQLVNEGLIEAEDLRHAHTLEEIQAKGDIDIEIAIIKTEGGFDKWDNEPGIGSKSNITNLADSAKQRTEEAKLARQLQRDERADFESDRKYQLDKQKLSEARNRRSQK